ncbi:MAG: hypothetical protein ACJ76H_03840 [Bacteriovoracaceae bacterium]
MKTILFIFMILQNAFALEVNLRDSKKHLVKADIEDSQVVIGAQAESEHFVVHLATEKSTLELNSDKISAADKLRATTVLYHLEIARKYFVETLGATYLENNQKMIVRIGMDKPYNEFYHFIPESKMSETNNAVTIPGSGNRKRSGVEPWDTEIWFRPAEKQKIDNVMFRAGKALNESGFDSSITGAMIDQESEQLVQQIAYAEGLSGVDYAGQITKVLITLGVAEFLPDVMMLVSKPFKSETYLDTAMIPEVSYHEFTHVALSDAISVRKSTPLNEGVANYFAAVINNSAKIAAKTGEWAKNISPYNGDKKIRYNSLLETNRAAHANFVFSFLWNLRQRFEKEGLGKEAADRLVFEARNHVTYADKPIKDDLIPSLIKSSSVLYTGSNGRRIRLIITDESIRAGI